MGEPSGPGSSTGNSPPADDVGMGVVPHQPGSSYRVEGWENAPEGPLSGAGRAEGPPERGAALHDKLSKTIEAIRPAVQADGGDIYLRGFDEETGVVTVELVGACVSCPASSLTLKAGVERILKDRVPGVTAVEAIGLESETAVSL